MKLATPFQLHCSYEDVINEWNINYDPYKYTKNDKLNQATNTVQESQMLFDKLISFVQTYSDKRINIAITDVRIPVNHLITLNKINPNIHIRLNLYQFSYIDKLKKENIKFFFDSDLPVSTFILLDELIRLGVTDVYIADDLCYNLEKVSKRCKKDNIQIRLILNKIPVTTPTAYTDVRAPIFTPRHFEVLDQYIDVAEFDCFYNNESDAYNWKVFNVLYKSWFIKHDWYNDLREINKDLEIFYPVRQEMPNFIERKVNCGRKCVYDDICYKCDTVVELANLLYDDGVYIKIEKDWVNPDKE